jgi:hexosaminidase
MRFRILALLAALAIGSPGRAAELNVMPLPEAFSFASGRLAVTREFTVVFKGQKTAALEAAVGRALRRWEERTGLVFPRTPTGTYAFAADPEHATLVIDSAAAAPELPQLGVDESYSLEVTGAQVSLRAPTTLGAQRGLETLLQLLESDSQGWSVPAIAIKDHPRFPWRGLLIDVARHWQPIEVIKRNLDGMALAKLNVLHLHLSDDQGFRVESKTLPRLHAQGSDGHYFTQEQIREIIAYAAARGIRVVPEFDMPGHSQSWFVGYPELASAPGPYQIERHWGVFNPVTDPTKETTYAFLEKFLGEMTALFPDPYFHIGGDENNGVQWSANAAIQAFIKEHDLKNNEGLHAYFNRRIQKILTADGKNLVGWDEILHPDLPASAVIQSWRGPKGLAAAAEAGHPVILSNGYYIDLCHPAADHYLNDPLPSTNALTAEQQARVLGGEATMWAEWATPETIDSRIWPRTAAIAERLWSPAKVNDVDAMYRRLDYASQRLTEAGLLHQTQLAPMLRRYAGDAITPSGLEALREFVAFVQPVQGYRRGGYQDGSQFLALTGLADCATPDSKAGRAFARAVDAVVNGKADPHSLTRFAQSWRELGARIQTHAAETGARAAELKSLSEQLIDAAAYVGDLLGKFASARADEAWLKSASVRLEAISRPQSAAELSIAEPLKLLTAAASEWPRREKLTPAEWRELVHRTAFPPEKP